MAVTTGSTITAVAYNSIRTTLNGVYSTLYGQTMRSSLVSATVDRVSSEQMLELFLDAQGAYVHQTGSLSNLISPPPLGQTIGANQSLTFNQSTGAKTLPVEGNIQGLNDFEGLVTSISNFDGSSSGWPDSSFSLGTPTTSTRSTTWGGEGQVQSVYHVITVTFASLTQRDQYFNAGGELRFSTSLSGGTGSKSNDWANLLTAIGTVKFDKYRLTASSGTPTVLGGSGYDSLTSTYRQLFIKSGSGVYADNDYTIEGRLVSDTVLRFRITFNDGDVGTNAGNPIDGTPIDEPVDGTLSSVTNSFRPDSSFVYDTVTYTAVSLPAPAIATAIALSSDNVSPPA